MLSLLKFRASILNFFLIYLAIGLIILIMSARPVSGSSDSTSLSLIVSDSLYIVENNYYRVELNSSAGGCITGIYSKEGSGKNLVQAISVKAEESFAWGRTFSQQFDPYANILVKENNINRIVLQASARLKAPFVAGYAGITVTNTLTFYENMSFFSVRYEAVFQKNMTIWHLEVETAASKPSNFNEAILSINGSTSYVIQLLGKDSEYSYHSKAGYLYSDFHNEEEGIGFIVPRAADFAPCSNFSVWDDRKSAHKFLLRWEFLQRGPITIEVKEGSRYVGEIVFNVHGKNRETTSVVTSALVGDVEGVFAHYMELQWSYQELDREHQIALARIDELEGKVEELTNKVDQLTANLYTYAQERLLLLLLLSLCLSVVIVVFAGIF